MPRRCAAAEKASQDREDPDFRDAPHRVERWECCGALYTDRGGRKWGTVTREFGCGTQPV
jgi:hypothetical protein